MDYLKELRDLTLPVCISGNEYEISRIYAEKLQRFSKNVCIDDEFNVTARIGKTEKNSLRILLSAHEDQFGFIVSKNNKNGLLSFVPTVDVNADNLTGSLLVLESSSGQTYRGLVPCEPSHIKVLVEKKDIRKKESCLDLGLSDETVGRHISVGDTIAFEPTFQCLANDYVSSSAMDDRAGLVCLLDVMEKLAKSSLSCEVVFAATSGGFVNCAGSASVANRVLPDISIILDVVPEVKEKGLSYKITCGGGPVVFFGGSSSPELATRLTKVAEKMDIPIQRYTPLKGEDVETGVLQKTSTTTETLFVGIPVRYQHTQNEIVSIRDLSWAADLLVACVQSLSEGHNNEY